MPAKAPADPYAGFEARIVPENITLLPKTAAETNGGNDLGEKIDRGEEGRQRRLDPARPWRAN